MTDLIAVYQATDPVAWRTRVADRRALAVLDAVEERGRGGVGSVAQVLGVHESQVNQYLARARALRRPANAARLAEAMSLPLAVTVTAD